MNDVVFKIPASNNSREHIYKKLYTIETKRFEHRFIPRSCSFYTNKIAVVAVAVNKKLNLVTFPTKTKETPKYKKFNFEGSINSISICEDPKNSDEYLLLVVTKNEAFIIDSALSITHIGVFPNLIAFIISYESNVYIISGNDDGIILKDSIDKSVKSEKNDLCSESSLSVLQVSPNKEFISCGFLNGSVYLLKTANLECFWKQTFSFGSIRAFAWNKFDNIVAFAAQDDNFYAVNLDNGYSTTCFEGHSSFVNSVSFDPFVKSNTQVVFSAAEDATIGIWISEMGDNRISNVKSSFIGPFENPIRHIMAMKYLVVTIDTGGTIVCWRKTKAEK